MESRSQSCGSNLVRFCDETLIMFDISLGLTNVDDRTRYSPFTELASDRVKASEREQV